MGSAFATTKEKGSFKVTKVSYDSWNCSPVVYGSNLRFKPMLISTSDLNGLFRVFNLPLPSTAMEGFVTEFLDDMPIEKLGRFGFPLSEVAYSY
ncbi:MAG TPA: hypothetical protein V6C76_07045 [Drouetiella sp.]